MSLFGIRPEPMRYRFHAWVGDRYVSVGPAEWAGDRYSLLELIGQIDPHGPSEGFHVHVTDEQGSFVRSYLPEDLPRFGRLERAA